MPLKAPFLALASFLVFPALSRAEEPPPACETVTTVRCSGSAASLAVPTPPAPTIIPPPPPVTQLDDREVPAAGCPCPPHHEYLPLQVNLRDGWRLVPQERGGFAAERTVRKRNPSVWAPGLAIWLTTYLGGSFLATHVDGGFGAIHWAPFWGAFAMGIVSSGDGARGAGYLTSAMLQMGGFAMMIAGLAGSKSIQRMPVQVTPYGSAEGAGISLGGRF